MSVYTRLIGCHGRRFCCCDGVNLVGVPTSVTLGACELSEHEWCIIVYIT